MLDVLCKSCDHSIEYHNEFGCSYVGETEFGEIEICYCEEEEL